MSIVKDNGQGFFVETLEDLKDTAKYILKETDWVMVEDVPVANKSQFQAYRWEVRKYMLNRQFPLNIPSIPDQMWSVDVVTDSPQPVKETHAATQIPELDIYKV